MTQYFDLLKEKYKLFPEKILEKDRKIGVELEFHVVSKDGSKPDFNKLKNILNLLLPILGYEKTEFDFDGNCIKGKKGDDLIIYEYGYGMIELSPGPYLDLHEIAKKAYSLIEKTERFLNEHGLTLLASGYNPFPWIYELPLINSQYWKTFAKFFEHFSLKKEFSHVNICTFICASQVQLDLSLIELPKFLNVINSLSWVKALLFANSPKILPNNKKCFCFRDILWQNLAHYSPKNIGVCNKNFSSSNEVFSEVLDNSIFKIKRENKYFFFQPLSFKDFLSKKMIHAWHVENNNSIPVEIEPKKSDIYFSRPYNAAAITHRGTVEIRSECQQPFKDLMSLSAFHLGILSNLEKIQALLKTVKNYTDKFTFSQMREKGIFECYDINLGFDVKKFIFELLILIKEGLISREKNEEIYLDPLFERLKNESNPAKEWFNKLEQGKTIPELVKEYSYFG